MSHENNVFDNFFYDSGNDNIVTSLTKKMFVLHFNVYISKNRCSKIKTICFYYDIFKYKFVQTMIFKLNDKWSQVGGRDQAGAPE